MKSITRHTNEIKDNLSEKSFDISKLAACTIAMEGTANEVAHQEKTICDDYCNMHLSVPWTMSCILFESIGRQITELAWRMIAH